MIADIEELEEMDASELHIRRLNAKCWRRKKVKLHIPSRRWNSKHLWMSKVSENIHLNVGASRTRRKKKSFRENLLNWILQPHFKILDINLSGHVADQVTLR